MKSVLKGRVIGTQDLERCVQAIATALRQDPGAREHLAERLEDEVIVPMGTPRRRDELKVLAEAQILRAICFAGMSVPRSRAAAEALLAGAQAGLELPPSARRTRALVSTALRLRRLCREAGELDVEARVTAVLLSGWQMETPRNEVLRKVLAALPILVRQLRARRQDGDLDILLREARHFTTVPGVAAMVRDLEREAARAWLQQGRPEQLLALPRHAELLTAEEELSLTIALSDAGVLDRAAHDQYVRVISGEPDARDRLGLSMQRLSRIGLDTRQGEIALRESLNESILPWYGAQGWPYVHMAIAAARRGEDERSIACFLVALELGADAAHALPVLVGSLCAVGFDRTADAVLREIEPSLHDVVIREVVQALAEAEDLMLGPSVAERGPALAAFFEEISHPLLALPGLAVRIHRARARLCRALGQHRAALASLDRALALRPADPGILIDLAECCIAAEQFGRARAVLEGGLAARSRRVLVANSRLALAHDDADLALACLEAALEQPEAPEDRCGRLVENLRVVFEIHAGLEGRGRGAGPLAKQLLEEVDQVCDVGTGESMREERLILEAADLASRLGNPAREAALLERLRRPGAAIALRLTRAQLAAGMPEAARRTLKGLDAEALRSVEARLLQGLVALGLRRWVEAREILDGLDARLPEAVLGRAWMAIHEGDFEAAKAALKDLPSELAPGHQSAAAALRRALGLPDGASSEPRASQAQQEPAAAADSPLRQRLREQLQGVEPGEFTPEREAALEALYRDAARAADHGVAHEALLTLTRLRDAARAEHQSSREALIKNRFEAGRFRAVIALTGGPSADAELSPAVACLRIRALAELGSIERALRELQRCKREEQSWSPALRSELLDAQRAVLFAASSREAGSPLTAVIESFAAKAYESARLQADKAVRMAPRDPVARYLLALATAKTGADVTARALAADAMEIAQRAERSDVVELARDLLAPRHPESPA